MELQIVRVGQALHNLHRPMTVFRSIAGRHNRIDPGDVGIVRDLKARDPGRTDNVAPEPRKVMNSRPHPPTHRARADQPRRKPRQAPRLGHEGQHV